MAITLQNGGTTLTLPEDLIWMDELAWSPISQRAERSITGALIVDRAVRVGGRTITLQGDGTSAWIDLATLRQLKAWSAQPGAQFVLTINSQAFTVFFDHGDAEETRAMAMEAVVEYSDPQDADYYCSLALRFLEI